MRTVEWKKVNGTMESHCIYTRLEAERMKIEHLNEWREGLLGDWVLTDDDHVVKVLAVNYDRGGRKLLRTCTMTTNAGSQTCELDTNPRISRYSVNGKNVNHPKFMTAKINTMCMLIITGMPPEEAYIRAYYGTSADKKRITTYIKQKVKRLMNTPVVQETIKAGLGDKLDQEGMTVSWLLRRYKNVIETGENESAQVSALNKIAQFHGLDGRRNDDTLPLPAIPQATLDALAGHKPAMQVTEDERPEVDGDGSRDVRDVADAEFETIEEEGDTDETLHTYVGGPSGFDPDAFAGTGSKP